MSIEERQLDRFRDEYEKRVWVAEFERGDRRTQFNAGNMWIDIVASADAAVLEFRERCK